MRRSLPVKAISQLFSSSALFPCVSLFLLSVLCFCPPVYAQNTPLSQAQYLFSIGSYDKASLVLENLLQSDPDNTDALVLLGQLNALLGRRSEAIQHLTRAIELRPDSASAYAALGTALTRFAEFDAARKAFEQAIVLDPQKARLHVNLAMTLAATNDMPSAMKELQSAISLDPSGPAAATAHYLLAKIYTDHDDEQKAIPELIAATKLKPDYPEAWLALGRTERAANHEAAALAAFQHAVAYAPHDPELQYELGSEYLSQGDAHNAAIHLQLARKYMPAETVAVLYKLERALRKEGLTEEAKNLQVQVKALTAKGDEAGKHSLEAQRLEDEGIEMERQNELAKAIEKYRAALELNPEQEGFRLNYGLALCRLHRWSEGIAEIKEVLQKDPGNIAAQRALYIAEDHQRQALAEVRTKAHP
ncbi:tetratricopeptide repeat protein [Pseudacidobacterium ailaaui]|jgi:tetratricopeptide (TPR) repeat protein|uniref:tetratricopeptide repeat protein n=1 Tax=Pseudacidobacterium ailaaui TaxID=1382359 RepID=UPI00047C62D9|nr:tetratricopeptide repeat protein [Pseudacidobacterium ailaaui]